MLRRPDSVKTQRLGQIGKRQRPLDKLVIGRGGRAAVISALDTLPVFGIVCESPDIDLHRSSSPDLKPVYKLSGTGFQPVIDSRKVLNVILSRRRRISRSALRTSRFA